MSSAAAAAYSLALAAAGLTGPRPTAGTRPGEAGLFLACSSGDGFPPHGSSYGSRRLSRASRSKARGANRAAAKSSSDGLRDRSSGGSSARLARGRVWERPEALAEYGALPPAEMAELRAARAALLELAEEMPGVQRAVTEGMNAVYLGREVVVGQEYVRRAPQMARAIRLVPQVARAEPMGFWHSFASAQADALMLLPKKTLQPVVAILDGTASAETVTVEQFAKFAKATMEAAHVCKAGAGAGGVGAGSRRCGGWRTGIYSSDLSDGGGDDRAGSRSDGAGSDGAGSDGAGSDGAGSDGAGSDGAGSDGAGSDGAGSDGAGSDGAGSDGGLIIGNRSKPCGGCAGEEARTRLLLGLLICAFDENAEEHERSRLHDRAVELLRWADANWDEGATLAGADVLGALGSLIPPGTDLDPADSEKACHELRNFLFNAAGNSPLAQTLSCRLAVQRRRALADNGHCDVGSSPATFERHLPHFFACAQREVRKRLGARAEGAGGRRYLPPALAIFAEQQEEDSHSKKSPAPQPASGAGLRLLRSALVRVFRVLARADPEDGVPPERPRFHPGDTDASSESYVSWTSDASLDEPVGGSVLATRAKFFTWAGAELAARTCEERKELLSFFETEIRSGKLLEPFVKFLKTQCDAGSQRQRWRRRLVRRGLGRRGLGRCRLLR